MRYGVGNVQEYRVAVDCLDVGVFIRLDIPWFQHPFLFGSFKIKNKDQIRILRKLGVSDVLVVPEKSDRLPGSAVSVTNSCEMPSDEEDQAVAAAKSLWQIKQERIAKLKAQRERIQVCEKQFSRALGQVKQIMANLDTASKEVVAEAHQFIGELVRTLIADKDVVVHLMNTEEGMENIFYHALNVTVLGLLLGREWGLDADSLRKLGLGLIFHDLGKQRIPKKILRKNQSLTLAELKLVQFHTQYGVEIINARVPSFPPESLEIIRNHHEALDGTGYPDRLIGSEVPHLVRLASVVNTYDNHCNKADPSTSLTPYQALSCMFRNQIVQLDKEIVALLVRSVGVYPPGTIVELSNGSVGLVVSVNSTNSLRPGILLYDSSIPRNEALIIEMEDDPDLSIVKSIHPGKLPAEIYNYLSPRTRVVYFAEPLARNKA